MRKVVLAALVLVLAATAPVDAALQGERFVANAMSLGTVSGTFRIEFTIERWSTDEERAQFLNILVEGGQEALGNAMHQAGADREIGFVRVNARLADSCTVRSR